mgnify:FL=1
MSTFRKLWQLPLHKPRALTIVLLIALLAIFTPQVDPTDWELNTQYLSDGLNIYDNSDYVYPPWTLIFFMPYRLMTAIGARICAVLVIAYLASRQQWQLGRFFAIIANPLFIFTLLFSNIDLVVITFAIVLWEASQDWKFSWAWRGLCLALLVIKPQATVLFIPYLLWTERHHLPNLAKTIAVGGILTLPISLLGSPPLLLQWVNNILTPSTLNQDFWDANNISMTEQLGIPLSIVILLVTFVILYLIMRYFNKQWTSNHMTATLLLSSMLLSPYTSTQSIIASLAFVPSWIATFLHYGLMFISNSLGLYMQWSSLWMLTFGVLALWFMPITNEREPA